MRFNAGYFGACAVVLALLGTVLAGFVLSVDKETVPYTNYDYVTDVSGLFSYDETPAYVDYNPSTNYVGYTAVTGTVGYTTTSTANNYRYIIEEGETVNLDTITITNNTTNPRNYLSDYFSNNPIMYFKPKETQINYDTPTVNEHTIYISDGAKSLYSLLDSIPNITSYATLSLNLAYTALMPVMIYAGDWTVYPSELQNSYRTTFEVDSDNITPDRLEVNAVTYQVEAYRDNVLMWTQTADKVGLFAWYTYNSLGIGYPPNPIEDIKQAPTSLTITGTATTYPTYAYMDPNAGVTINPVEAGTNYYEGRVVWTNGYPCDEVTFKFLANNFSNLEVIARSGNTDGQTLTINHFTGSEGLSVSYIKDGVLTFVPLGIWPALQVTISASENTVTLTPTNNTSLLTTEPAQIYSKVLNGQWSTGDIDSITFSTYGTRADMPTPHWQITNTSVFLNTYNTVMNDPTIDIKDYFPDIGDYRLNFYSFALMGTGFNINGTDFEVNRDNATVTFTYGLAPVTHKLKNIYVSTDNEHTYLTFADVNKKYDLGETTTDTVSFTGYWYFSTGLYEARDGVTSEYVWDLDGAFHADAGQCIVIFFAILGGFVVIGHVYGRVNVKALDWVIIAFAGFMAYVYFGGLIV